jgi:hypothetical protein
VPTILLELQNAGRLAPGAVTASTVRRLLREHGLDRVSQKFAAQAGERGRLRLRWEAEATMLLWHSDARQCSGNTFPTFPSIGAAKLSRASQDRGTPGRSSRGWAIRPAHAAAGPSPPPGPRS